MGDWSQVDNGETSTAHVMIPVNVFFILLCTDLKLHLQSTDYGNFLQNEAGPLNVSVIDDRLREKLVTEFRHLRNQALEPMATFMDFIT